MTRRAPRVVREPIKYTVGDGPEDALTPEQYEKLFDAISEWFIEWRTEPAPASDVRLRLKCCLEGRTLGGEKWYSHWNSPLASRVRMLCRYDMVKMKPIQSPSQAYQKKAEEKKRKQRAQAQAGDPLLPDLVRKELKGTAAYGDNPTMLLTQAEHRAWIELRESYLKQFPELDNVASRTELEMLCDLQMQQERQRLKLLRATPDFNAGTLLDLSKAVVELKKALGIHPDQLAKRVDPDRQGSIAEAIKKLSPGGVDRARELRDRFFLEEMLQLWKMYHTPSPNPNSGGYQLDDIRLFAHTKCRTCACSRCGQRNFVGIDIEEIEEYLEHHDVITVDSEEDAGESSPTPDVMSVDASAEASAEEVGGGAPSSPVDGADEPPLMFADVQAAA